jgi:hypothetical protein
VPLKLRRSAVAAIRADAVAYEPLDGLGIDLHQAGAHLHLVQQPGGAVAPDGAVRSEPRIRAAARRGSAAGRTGHATSQGADGFKALDGRHGRRAGASGGPVVVMIMHVPARSGAEMAPGSADR